MESGFRRDNFILNVPIAHVDLYRILRGLAVVPVRRMDGRRQIDLGESRGRLSVNTGINSLSWRGAADRDWSSGGVHWKDIHRN